MVVINLGITEFAFAVDDFMNPKEFKDGEAICTLLVRLLLLEPGTIQSHPDMGIGLMSKYRYSAEGTASVLQNDLQRQVDRYLPSLQGTKVTVTERDSKYYIAAEFESVLYGVSFDTSSGMIQTNTASLADL